MSKTYFDRAVLKANTENGKDWLEKYLHPPSSRGNSYNGFPDKSVVSAIHPEFRLTKESTQYVEKVEVGLPKHRLLLLHAPGLTSPIFAASATTYSDFNNWKTCLKNNQVTTEEIITSYGRVRNAYLSTTCELDTTSLANSGMVYASQFSPAIFEMTLGDVLNRMEQLGQNNKSYQRLKQLLDRDINRNSVKRGDDAIYVDEGYDIVKDISTLKIKPKSVGLKDNLCQIVRLGKPVVEGQDVIDLSPKFYQARSTEGMFMVHSNGQDQNRWLDIKPGRIEEGKVTRNLMHCFYETTWGVNNTTTIEYFDDNGAYTYDVPWGDYTWGFSLWDNFTGENQLTSNIPAISIKTILGVEISPSVRSMMNSLAKAPALYDPTALDTASILIQARQDAMPASMNAGGIMSAIGAMAGPEGAVAGTLLDALAPDNKAEMSAMKREIKAAPEAAAENDLLSQTQTAVDAGTAATGRPIRYQGPLRKVRPDTAYHGVGRDENRKRVQVKKIYVYKHPKNQPTVVRSYKGLRRPKSRRRSSSRGRSASRNRSNSRKRSNSRRR